MLSTVPPCSPYEEKITEGSCWNASVPRHSQKSHSFKCWWGQADNTGWIFKFQHLWCFMPSVWECPRGHTATQPLNLHPALKRKHVRIERRRRKTGELKWCSGLNEPPLSPLYSHYYVDLSSRVTMEVPLDLALWRQSLVQLKCPSCIFSWRYYLFFKRILGENPEFKRHQQGLAIFSFSFIFVYLTG